MDPVTLIVIVVATLADYVSRRPNSKRALGFLLIGLFAALGFLTYAAHNGMMVEEVTQREQELAECRASAQRIGVFTNPITGKSTPIMTCPRE